MTTMHRRLAVVAVGLGLVVGLTSLVVGVVPVRPAAAQEVDRPTGEPCVPGASLPQPGEPPNGPSPVGRCEPTATRRAVDTAIWIVTLATLVGVAVLGAVAVRRDRRDADPG